MEKRVLGWENPDLPGVVGVKVVLKGKNPQEHLMLGALVRSISCGTFSAEMRAKVVRIRKRRRKRGGKKKALRKVVTKISFRYLYEERWASLALRRPRRGSDERMYFDALVDLLQRTRHPIVHTTPHMYIPSVGTVRSLTLIFAPSLPHRAEEGKEGLPRT